MLNILSSTGSGYAPTDTFLFNGVPTSIQAVIDGEIPGLRYNAETGRLESARKVERNAYGKMEYSLWDSEDTEPTKNVTVGGADPSRIVVLNTTEGSEQYLVSPNMTWRNKAFQALMRAGYSTAFRNWLSDHIDILDEWTNEDGSKVEVVQLEYEYQKFLSTMPTYEEQDLARTRKGAEYDPNVDTSAPDIAAMKGIIYTDLANEIGEQYAKIAQAQLEAQAKQLEVEKAQLELQKKAQDEAIKARNASENLLQFIARKLTEGGEGETKSWEDFTNRVLPRLRAVGTLAQDAKDLYELRNAPTDPEAYRKWRQEQRLESQQLRAYTNIIGTAQDIATGQTLARKVQPLKADKPTRKVIQKRKKYSTEAYYKQKYQGSAGRPAKTNKRKR